MNGTKYAYASDLVIMGAIQAVRRNPVLTAE